MTLSEQAAKAIKDATGWDAYQSRNGAGVNSAGGTDIRLYWHAAAGEWRSYIKNKRLVLPERGEGPTPEAALNDVLPRYRAHIASLAADILPGWPRLEWGEWQKQSPSFPYAVAALTFEAWGARRAVAKLISRDGTVCGWDNERVYYPGMTPETVRAAMIAHVETLGLPCPLPPFPGASDA